MTSLSNSIPLEGFMDFNFSKLTTDPFFDEPRSEDDNLDVVGLLREHSGIGPLFIFGVHEPASFDTPFSFLTPASLFLGVALGAIDPFTATPFPLPTPTSEAFLQFPSTPIEHSFPDTSSPHPDPEPEPAPEPEDIPVTITQHVPLPFHEVLDHDVLESVTNTIPLSGVIQTCIPRLGKRAREADDENLAPSKRVPSGSARDTNSSIHTEIVYVGTRRVLLSSTQDYFATNITEDGTALTKIAAYVCRKCDHRCKSKGDVGKHVEKHYPPSYHCKAFGCPCPSVEGKSYRRKSAMECHIKSKKGNGEDTL